MIGVWLLPRHRIALVAVAVAGGACGPRLETATPSEQSRPTAKVSAYDDGPLRGRVTARVVCKADAFEGTTWFDIAIFGTGPDAHRLCDATLRRVTGDHACRVGRACIEQPLGPAPEVSSNATILRHTLPIADLTVLLDAAEEGRPPDEVTGEVHEHVAFATRDECVTHAAMMTRRMRDREERDARQWREGQLEGFERGQREAREQLEDLERRTGGPVAGRMAKLQAELAREQRPAEQKRIQRAMIDVNLAELEDAHLRQSLAQYRTLIEALRSPAPPSPPTETFTCFAPHSRQSALDIAK